jgi:hypothetical protein
MGFLLSRPAGRPPAGPEEETLEPEAGDETEPRGVATDESARAMPAVGSHEDGDEESRAVVAESTASRPPDS